MKLLLSKCKLGLCLIVLYVVCSSGIAKLNNIYVQPLIAFGCAYSGTRESFEESLPLMLIVPFLVGMLKVNEWVGMCVFFIMLVFSAYRPLKLIKIFIIGFLSFFVLEIISGFEYIDFFGYASQLIITAALYNTLIFMAMRKLCEIWFPASKRNIFI